MPLSKRVLHNSGLFAPPDIYAEATPATALNDVNMARTIGVIQQISNLGMFAAELFDNLARLSEDTADRLKESTARCNILLRQLPSVETKVMQTEIAVVEDDIQKKNVSKRIPAATPIVISKKTNCSQINAQYNMCNLPPQLWKIESIIPEDCMIAFSNPGLFFEEWLKGEQERQEEQRKERKKTKELRKKTKQEKKKKRNKDSKTSLAGTEKSLLRQRMDMKAQKNRTLPPPLPPPDIDNTDQAMRKSSSFRLFDSFDTVAAPSISQEDMDPMARPPPPTVHQQQPLRRPPPSGAVRKMASNVAPPVHRMPRVSVRPPPVALDDPGTPPPPSPFTPPPATPELEPTPPPADDAQVLRRPPSLNIPTQLAPPPRRRASILQQNPEGVRTPGSASGVFFPETADPGSGPDAKQKTPKRRQSLIQSTKFVKSPSVVGSSTPLKSPGVHKLFGSSVMTPEAIAALTITADTVGSVQPQSNLSTPTPIKTQQTPRSSGGLTPSPVDKQHSNHPKVLSGGPSNMRVMESILEDNEDAESKMSSQNSRRSSITKQRLESGGYKGGLNPFTSEALGKADGAIEDQKRMRSMMSTTSGVSALTDGFDSSIGDSGPIKNISQRKKSFVSQFSTFAEDNSPDPNPTGLSQALMNEPTSPTRSSFALNFGYNKDRFSMDVTDAWYRNSFAPQDRQPISTVVSNDPVAEYAFVPMPSNSSIGSHDSFAQGKGQNQRRGSIDSKSTVSDAPSSRRKSFLDINPFKSVSAIIEEEEHTETDLRPQLATEGSVLSGTSDVHIFNSSDAADADEGVSYDNAVDQEQYKHSESVPVSDYDYSYAGDYGGSVAEYEEDGAQKTGTGGYYLATDGNYYYYEDADYYDTTDAQQAGDDQIFDHEGDELWNRRSGFLSAIKEGDITLRRTPATQKYMDTRSEVLAQIRTGAVSLRKMQPTMKPSTDQRHDAIAAILSNRQKIAGSESDSDDSSDSGFDDDDW